MFVLFLLLFKFIFAGFAALIRLISSVSSSSLLFFEVFSVHDFPLFPEFRESWEGITYQSMECSHRSSVLTFEPELLVATVEVQVHINKVILIGMESGDRKPFVALVSKFYDFIDFCLWYRCIFINYVQSSLPYCLFWSIM